MVRWKSCCHGVSNANFLHPARWDVLNWWPWKCGKCSKLDGKLNQFWGTDIGRNINREYPKEKFPGLIFCGSCLVFVLFFWVERLGKFGHWWAIYNPFQWFGALLLACKSFPSTLANIFMLWFDAITPLAFLPVAAASAPRSGIKVYSRTFWL